MWLHCFLNKMNVESNDNVKKTYPNSHAKLPVVNFKCKVR